MIMDYYLMANIWIAIVITAFCMAGYRMIKELLNILKSEYIPVDSPPVVPETGMFTFHDEHIKVPPPPPLPRPPPDPLWDE
jgi:hypothetical protein